MKIVNEYIDSGEFTFLLIRHPKYGVISFLIDTEDVEKVKQYNWTIICGHHKYEMAEIYYASTGKNILLHRFLIDAPKGTVCDHINGNSLDCRKNNLQITDYVGNARKGAIKANNKSGVSGVTWNKYCNKWMAYIGMYNKQIRLGSFNNLEDAIKARKDAEKELWGVEN